MYRKETIPGSFKNVYSQPGCKAGTAQAAAQGPNTKATMIKAQGNLKAEKPQASERFQLVCSFKMAGWLKHNQCIQRGALKAFWIPRLHNGVGSREFDFFPLQVSPQQFFLILPLSGLVWPCPRRLLHRGASIARRDEGPSSFCIWVIQPILLITRGLRGLF